MCNHPKTKVVDSRKNNANYIIRRRKCLSCNEKLPTIEINIMEMTVDEFSKIKKKFNKRNGISKTEEQKKDNARRALLNKVKKAYSNKGGYSERANHAYKNM